METSGTITWSRVQSRCDLGWNHKDKKNNSMEKERSNQLVWTSPGSDLLPQTWLFLRHKQNNIQVSIKNGKKLCRWLQPASQHCAAMWEAWCADVPSIASLCPTAPGPCSGCRAEALPTHCCQVPCTQCVVPHCCQCSREAAKSDCQKPWREMQREEHQQHSILPWQHKVKQAVRWIATYK